MNSLLIPVESDEFRNNVKIKFNNILNGFDNYMNFTLDAQNINDSENIIISFIEKILEMNNNECYIDLFLNTLSEKDKFNLTNLVDHNDKGVLKQIINLNHNTPYYKLDDKSLIPFLTRLNTREIFFVTFYFTKKPVTIWGNYNLKFPCFFDNSNTLNEYLNIAEKLNFNISNINSNL